MGDTLLEVRQIKRHFPVAQGVVFMRTIARVKAVDGVTFAVQRGDTFGIVGESGCGKTTLARMILLLERPDSGEILFKGRRISLDDSVRLKEYRSSVQAVFQDPYSSLNPRMRIGDIIAEPMIGVRQLSRNEIYDKVCTLLEQVGLSAASAKLYPHEFSGGQRQRIAVARALTIDPDLVILDEPVSALDLSVRAQLLNLLRQLQNKLGLTYILIAHDLAVVRHMSDHIGVMYLGKLVETAGCDEVYDRPLHPYTSALLLAALPTDPDAPKVNSVISGEVPSPLNPPSGCRFHPRCPEVRPICSQLEPPLLDLGAQHLVACHMYNA